MKCRIILELLVILFFTGCYNREQISRLDEAEALLQNKPDSALTILQQLKSEGGQAEQARYALLYSEALDKNHIKVTNDSLIRQAWSHYKHHPKDLRRQCKTLYYWGRVKLRAGDKPGALRLFLEIEEKLKDTNEPYYAGLLYSQIGEVYYDQMNYSRAYHYFVKLAITSGRLITLVKKQRQLSIWQPQLSIQKIWRKPCDSILPHSIWLMSTSTIS